MNAIRILGEKRYERAVPVFEEMVAAGQDGYTLREIVFALSRIKTRDSHRLLAELRKHPSVVVRSAYDETVGASSNGAKR